MTFTQSSQELRLVSPKGGFVDFVAGLYFMHAADREQYSRGATRISLQTCLGKSTSTRTESLPPLAYASASRGYKGPTYMTTRHHAVSSSGSYVTNLANAGNVANRGIELSFAAAPLQSLTYRLAGLYNEAFSRRFSCDLELLGCHVNGNQLPFAPKWRVNASQDYQRRISDTLDLDLNVAYRWQSRTQFQYIDSSDLSQPSYGIWDVSVSLGSPARGWSAALLFKNVFDKDYTSYMANADLGVGSDVRWVPRDASRYVGLNLQLNF